MEAAAFVIAKT